MKNESAVYKRSIKLNNNRQGIIKFTTENNDTELKENVAKIIASHIVNDKHFQEKIFNQTY